MKYILIATLLVSMFSCGKNTEKEGDTQVSDKVTEINYGEKDALGRVEIKYPYKHGDDSPAIIKFSYDVKELDSAKVNKAELEQVIMLTAVYGKFKAKNKHTFKFDENKSNLIYMDGNTIVVSCSGIAQNAYGTPSEITILGNFVAGEEHTEENAVIMAF